MVTFGVELELGWNQTKTGRAPNSLTIPMKYSAIATDYDGTLATEGLVDPDPVAGSGDAENDEHLLATCGYGVAVANALPALKAKADWVTSGGRGAGGQELIHHLLDQFP
jgi:hypothetical protein